MENAWQMCMGFLHASKNHYVLMYSVNVIEGVVARRWLRMMSDEKSAIRKTLSELLMSNQMPAFMRNKVCKLMVDIGRFDWPHFYPDFFNNIFQLIQNPATTYLGVVLLKTASEEFGSPRDDLCASRKRELKNLLSGVVPQMLTALTGVLDSILEKQKASSTTTPPPSPTYTSDSNSQSSSAGSLPNDFLPQMFFSLCPRSAYSPVQNRLDCENRELALVCLATLEHITTWVAVGNNFGPSMLNTLFNFAALGCACRSELNCEVAVAALSCVNELLYKKFFTQKDTQACLMQIFQNAFQLLQLVTKESCGVYALNELDEAFLNKLTEFFHILVESHLRRFEDSYEAGVQQFLQLLQVYTFRQKDVELYLSTVDTWLALLASVELSGRATKYKPMMAVLFAEVMAKILIKNNNQIHEIPWEATDSDWERFLCKNLQLTSKISELMMEDSCVQLVAIYDQSLNEFCATPQPSSTSIRDLATITRAVGCLSTALSSLAENCVNIAQLPMKLAADFLRCLQKSESVRIQNGAGGLFKALNSLERECLASIQAFIYLLNVTLQRESPVTKQLVMSIAEVSVDVCLGRPEVAPTAAGLLMSLTGCFRVSYLMDTVFKKLFPLVTRFTPTDDLVCVKRTAVCLQNVCILPWSDLPQSEQNWEARRQHYESLVHSLISFKNHNVVDLDAHIAISFATATAMVDALTTVCGKSKALAAPSFERLLEAATSLPPQTMAIPIVGENLVSFLKACFQVIQRDMNSQLMDGFLTRLIDFMPSLLDDSKTQSSCYIEGFLDLLREVLLSPSKGGSFLRKIINLAVYQLWPRVAVSAYSDLKPCLVSIMHHILLYHWKYFFPTNVVHMISSSGSPSTDTDVAHQEVFVKIMEVYGACLMQTDLALFSQVLQSLQELNSRWKLYKRSIFERIMLSEFLNVLLQSLCTRSHDLLREEILSTVFNMSQAMGLGNMQQSFMPQFLLKLEGLDNYQREQLVRSFNVPCDLPSFTESLNNLINDVRYYVVCNQSLPPSSVVL